MKPAYAIYLLESSWSWDHTNTEVATFTIEGTEGFRYRKELECIVDPNCLSGERDRILDELKSIARAQGQCPLDPNPRLIRLYRVVDYDGILRIPARKGETPKLNLVLNLICEFDRDGRPIKPREAVGNQS